MPLAEALLVLAEDQRDVGVAGGGASQRPDHHHLLGGVGDVVLAAQHVGDAHVEVVHGRGQVVGRGPVRAHDDEVLDRAVLERHRAAHVVLDDGLPLDLDGETPGGAHPRGLERGDLGRVAVAAAAHHGGAPVGAGGGPLRLELLVALVGRVDGPGRLQARDGGGVHVPALALAEGPLVPVQPQPGEAAQDLGLALGRRALAVGVLHAQHEGAAGVTGDEPVEQRRPGATHMEGAGRARREPHASGTGHLGSLPCHARRIAT